MPNTAPPSTPPTQQQADQAQRARFAAELAILKLFQSSGGGGGEGEDEGSALHTVAIIAIIAALSASIISTSLRDPRDGDKSQLETELDTEHMSEDLIAEAQRVFQDLSTSDLTDEQKAVLWATWAHSRTASHIADLVGKSVGKELKKVWISRSDNRVRLLHAKLHGKTIPSSDDFWRWPDTGQRLRWPGDPEAPPEAVIGCRCVCLLTWASQDDVSTTIRRIVEKTNPN